MVLVVLDTVVCLLAVFNRMDAVFGLSESFF